MSRMAKMYSEKVTSISIFFVAHVLVKKLHVGGRNDDHVGACCIAR